MEKLFKSSIVGWIELFVLMAGVFLVFINYNLPIATGYDKVADIPLIFLSLGIVSFWKQLVVKKTNIWILGKYILCVSNSYNYVFWGV